MWVVSAAGSNANDNGITYQYYQQEQHSNVNDARKNEE